MANYLIFYITRYHIISKPYVKSYEHVTNIHYINKNQLIINLKSIAFFRCNNTTNELINRKFKENESSLLIKKTSRVNPDVI